MSMKTPLNDEAQATLLSVDPVSYASERNYIGHSSRLSVYITRGVLTLPQVRASLLKKYTNKDIYKFVFELAWREYWQREWKVRGSAVFADIKSTQSGVESEEMPISVINAATGIDVLDQGLRELYETGYIHNHMRLWLSGLLCNIGHTKWQQPAKWMYYYLLDGDPASNYLSWQWVAGTFSSKRYLPSQENINLYSKTKQLHTFLDQSYEVLSDIKTPDILKKRTTIDLKWRAPKCDELHIDTSKPTLLYHSFWLNQEWHKDIEANRILVLEPSWFHAFPVSDMVIDTILNFAHEILDMQVYVGNVEDLTPKLDADIRYMLHPSVLHWPGTAEDMPALFPGVPLRSYNSFMSFWKQCEKQL